MGPEHLIAALQKMKVETGSFACFGCGHEHDCGVHGCAILREAAEELEALYTRVRESGCCEDCAHVAALEHCPDDWSPCPKCSTPDCYCRDCRNGSKWEWRGHGKERQ